MNQKSIIITAFLLPLLATVAWAQAPSLDARVNLNIVERPLKDVVAGLREKSGANIVVVDPPKDEQTGKTPPKISEALISIDLSDVPWRDALELVAEKAHVVVEERAGGVLAVVSTYKATFDFPGVDIRTVIETIGKAAGASIAVGKEVTGNITVRFVGVPWRDALDVTAKTLGFVVVEEKHGVLRVVDPKTLQDQMETKTYQLRYLRPKSSYKPLIKSEFVQSNNQQEQAKGGGLEDFKKTFTVLQALSKALSANGQLDYMDMSNVVIVKDTAQVQGAVRDMLARLDIEPVQVFCDVKFVSTSNGDILNLGVDYGDNGPQVTMTGGQIPITFPFKPGAGGWDDWIIASPSGQGPFVDPLLNGGKTLVPDTVFGALSFQQVQATLRLLQRDSKSEVIQAPKIVTLDGHEATIFVGETIRYAEAKSEQGQSGGLQLSVAEASGSPVEVGFQLLIRPNVIPGTEKMVMEIIPKETSLSGTGISSFAPPGFDVFTIGASGLQGSIALPRTRSSTIVTTMMLETGQTAVIGGLSTDQDTETHTAVPGLSLIPILGELFKHQSKNRDRRSLMVFLTPTIVHSSEDAHLLLEQELRRRKTALKEELDTLLTNELTGGKSPKN